MKVLNLYAGIGGNRKLWEDVEVTAVEWDEQRAAVYADLFPDDKVIVGDAHQYLLDHYKEFDFIWSSPPCPTHGQMRYRTLVIPGRSKAVYPDMKLWQEIIFLEYHAPGKYCVENVELYYKPLVVPQKSGRHFFWTNFHISPFDIKTKGNIVYKNPKQLMTDLDMQIDLEKHPLKIDGIKDSLGNTLRNCVHPTLGKHILDCARGQSNQPALIEYKQEALI